MEVVSTSSVFRVTLRVRREDLRESHERSRLLPPRSTAEWGARLQCFWGETASPLFRIKRSFGCDGAPLPRFRLQPEGCSTAGSTSRSSVPGGPEHELCGPAPAILQVSRVTAVRSRAHPP
jgi:hypothetical protein